jgi:uncharacterized surface protein with fasciclin (FAS1) repeats
MKVVLLLITMATVANAGAYKYHHLSNPSVYQPRRTYYHHQPTSFYRPRSTVYQPRRTFYHHNVNKWNQPHFGIPTYAPKTPDTRIKPVEEENDVVQVAIEAGGFETLLELVEQEGLTDRLKDDECKTVLAPTNEVFDQRPPGALDGLIETDTVADVLVKHVIPQCLTSDQIESGFVKTAGGVEIELIKNPEDGSVQIKSGTGLYKIVQSDILASNGVIHVVDGVFV